MKARSLLEVALLAAFTTAGLVALVAVAEAAAFCAGYPLEGSGPNPTPGRNHECFSQVVSHRLNQAISGQSMFQRNLMR